jgi:hypothetical protein
MNSTNLEQNPSLSFLERWVSAFTRILKKIGFSGRTDNEKFANSILSDEIEAASTQEAIKMVEEKKKMLIDMCDDVDSFYAAKEEASKSRDLESWFKKKVSDFTHETIPNADKSDFDEVEKLVSDSMDHDIALKTKLLEEELASDSEGAHNNNSNDER